MPKQQMKATVVAVTERSFDSFTTREGETVPAGKTCRAWVVEADDQPPISVKVTATQAEALRGAGPFGVVVELDCWLKANGNRIEYQADKDGLSIIG